MLKGGNEPLSWSHKEFGFSRHCRVMLCHSQSTVCKPRNRHHIISILGLKSFGAKITVVSADFQRALGTWMSTVLLKNLPSAFLKHRKAFYSFTVFISSNSVTNSHQVHWKGDTDTPSSYWATVNRKWVYLVSSYQEGNLCSHHITDAIWTCVNSSRLWKHMYSPNFLAFPKAINFHILSTLWILQTSTHTSLFWLSKVNLSQPYPT